MNAAAYIGQFAAIARRMIVQAGAVADDAAPYISAGTYTSDRWVKSATQLTDIAALGAMEIAENVIAGPGAAMTPIKATSDEFQVTPSMDTQKQRQLRFSKKLARAGTIDEIPSSAVKFVSPDDMLYQPGTLPANAKTFKFTVDITDLPSGVYVGEVTVKLKDGIDLTPPVQVDIAL